MTDRSLLARYEAELRRLRLLLADEFAAEGPSGTPILLTVRVVRGS